MSVVTTRTLRLVTTVDLEAVLEEIVESAPEDVVGIVVALAASAGEDVTRELISQLNDLEWIEEEPEAEEEEAEPDILGDTDDDE